MASSEKSFHVIPLKGATNYQTWKVQVRMALIRENLWHIVNGTEQAPAPDSSDYSKFSARRDKALATIVLTLDPELIYLIGDAEDPIKVWKELENTYQKKSVANKFSLRKKLINTKFQTGTSLQNHAKIFSETYSSLAAIGEPLDNDDKVFYLLCSLPESFDMVVTTIENCEKLPDFQVVLQKLLAHEKKIEERKNDSESSNALIIKKDKNKRKCNHCKKIGHFAKQCWILHPELKKPRLSKEVVNKVSPDNSKQDDLDCVGLVAHYAFASNDISAKTWIVDSGATSHMTNNRNLFTTFQSCDGENVCVGDGHTLTVEGKGKVNISFKLKNNNVQKLQLNDVLYIPEISYNLLSISKSTEKGIKTNFAENECCFMNFENKVIAIAKKENNLYKLCNIVDEKTYVTSNETWHRRLGHINSERMKDMSIKEKVIDFDYDHKIKDFDKCEPCIKGKINRLPFHKKEKDESKEILELIHSDVCGKLEKKSLGGAEYFISFTDDKSRYVWTYPMKNKSDAFGIFKKFKYAVEKEFGHYIKTLRTDNGGEYCSTEFETFLIDNGIHHEKTVPMCPEQNGVSERLNRTLIESVRSMLADSKLDKSFWAEALNTATYIKNISSTSTINNMTPFEALKKEKPSLKHLKVFGCVAYAHIPKEKRLKLDEKARKCIFLGYSNCSKGFRLYDMEKKKVFIERNVIFDENKICQKQETTENNKILENYVRVEESESENEENSETENIEPQLPKRVRRPPQRYGEWVYATTDFNLPNSAEDGLNDRNWKKAMDSEIQSMHMNNVYDLVELPEGKKVVKSKWIFKTKNNEGNVLYKARLVAQGYSQKLGEDYNETFSPVARFESIRTLLALSVKNKYKVHHMDIKTAFLNGDLHEEIYMEQPAGYVKQGEENLVCCLRKSIYGLKQSPRCWNFSIDQQLSRMGFIKLPSDECIYKSDNILIGLYVDDLIIAGSSSHHIAEVKQQLSNRYDVKDLGSIKEFLGVKILQSNDSIWLGQPEYISSILEKFNMSTCNPIETPADSNVKLTLIQEGEEHFDAQVYQSAVGALIYLSTRTRPDISFAVHQVSRFNSNPSKAHWSAVKRIFRYLKGTIHLGIKYSCHPDGDIVAYSDSDFAGDVGDRKSVSGFIFMLQSGPVTWSCKKQPTVALSSAEAEYVSLCRTAQEAVWITQLMSDLGEAPSEPFIIYEDNLAAISMSKNSEFHAKTKHIDVKTHFVRDLVKNNKITVQHVPSCEMLADIFTKPLVRDKFRYLRESIGVVSNSV